MSSRVRKPREAQRAQERLPRLVALQSCTHHQAAGQARTGWALAQIRAVRHVKTVAKLDVPLRHLVTGIAARHVLLRALRQAD